MRKTTANFKAALGIALAAACLRCGSAQKKDEPPVTALPKSAVTGKEPEFAIKSFGVLPKATQKADLPYLADATGTETDSECFEAAKGLEPWDTGHLETLKNMSRHKQAINRAVAAWFGEVIAPRQTPGPGADELAIEIETPSILHAPLSQVRLAPQARCIGDETGFLAQRSRAVTTLFGARVFHFQSSEPIENKTLVHMKRAARKARMKLEEAESYVRARDEEGKPAFSPDGKKLYTSPDGKLITKKQIPRPKDRVAFEWTLSSKTPLYFAWGDLPDRAWAKERDREKCTLYLVYDDAAPRVPECPGFSEAGFGVSRGQIPDEVVIKVTADHETGAVTTAFGRREMIQVGGRIAVWVEADKIEEGAFLRIDSLVLDPGTGPPDALRSFAPDRPKRKRKGR